MNLVLGLNAFHGDSAAALLRGGRFIAGVEEERLNRMKHWAGFPVAAARQVLDDAGWRLDDLNAVTISRDPSAHLLDKVLFAFRKRPSFDAVRSRLSNQMKVTGIEERLAGLDRGKFRGKIYHVEHHLAHLVSTFFCSPFDEAACLTIDAFGDFLSSMSAVGRGNRLTVLDTVAFPHSLGIFYTAMTQFLGFRSTETSTR
jgi:carbamoyltransferase